MRMHRGASDRPRKASPWSGNQQANFIEEKRGCPKVRLLGHPLIIRKSDIILKKEDVNDFIFKLISFKREVGAAAAAIPVFFKKRRSKCNFTNLN